MRLQLYADHDKNDRLNNWAQLYDHNDNYSYESNK